MRPISDWCSDIHAWAHAKGFYDQACSPPCRHASGSRASAIMLIVTELAEAVEADRKSEECNFREEIADAAIRLFDLCGAEGIDLEAEIVAKMKRNQSRPHKHGKAY